MGYDFVFFHQIRKIFAIISYHYQNQTDKPEGISKAAWDKRCKDWDDAIDSDYIPAHHGFGINLYDVEYIFPVFDFKNKKINFPTEECMLKKLRTGLQKEA